MSCDLSGQPFDFEPQYGETRHHSALNQEPFQPRFYTSFTGYGNIVHSLRKLTTKVASERTNRIACFATILPLRPARWFNFRSSLDFKDSFVLPDSDWSRYRDSEVVQNTLGHKYRLTRIIASLDAELSSYYKEREVPKKSAISISELLSTAFSSSADVEEDLASWVLVCKEMALMRGRRPALLSGELRDSDPAAANKQLQEGRLSLEHLKLIWPESYNALLKCREFRKPVVDRKLFEGGCIVHRSSEMPDTDSDHFDFENLGAVMRYYHHRGEKNQLLHWRISTKDWLNFYQFDPSRSKSGTAPERMPEDLYLFGTQEDGEGTEVKDRKWHFGLTADASESLDYVRVQCLADGNPLFSRCKELLLDLELRLSKTEGGIAKIE